MKSILTKMILTAIPFGALMLAGWGSAQAAPGCSPTYSITSTNVTLTANCTPDPGESINFADGYDWVKDGSVSVGSTGLITQTTSAAAAHNYKVRAQNAPAAGFGAYSLPVTVVAGPPSPCDLNVQIAGGAPSAGPVTIAPGAAVTLIPTCNGADSLEWHSQVGGTGPYTHIIAPPGGIVFPATGTTKYKVVGSNDYGDSASGEVIVNATPPVAVPSCSLSPASASKITGASAQLFSSTCSNTPTSYSWTIDGNSVGSSSSYTTASNLGLGLHTVALIASNSGGPSSPATASLTVTSTPTPSCTLSPSSASKNTGATAQLFSSNCTNTPTSYAWTVDGNSVGSSSSYTTASNLGLGSHNVALIASNAGGPGSQAIASLTVSDVIPPPVAGCSTIPVTWASTVQIGVTPLETMSNGSTYAFKVDYTGIASGKAGLLYSSPGTVGKFVSLSKTPCAFEGADVGAYCTATARDNNPVVSYSTAASTGTCNITSGIWYINVRNSKTATGTDECPAGTKCTYYVRW